MVRLQPKAAASIKARDLAYPRSRGEAMEYFKTTSGTAPANDLS